MKDSVASPQEALLAFADQLEVELSPAQADALLTYLALLQRWNATYNLTSVRDPSDMLRQHLVDCLAIVAPLRRKMGAAYRLLDVGSGAGLPGVVIAILEPGVSVTCVDSVGKKAAFIQQAAAELRFANLRARHSRVEDLEGEVFDVVVSRAFASLADFTQITRQRLAPNGIWAAMKGKNPADELAQLEPNIEMFHVEQLRVPGLNAERCIVWMRPGPTL